MSSNYSIQPAGDHAVTVYFGNKIDEMLNKKVLHLDQLLRQDPITGVLDIIPAYASLTVVYDPLKIIKTGVPSASIFIIDALNKFLNLPEEEILSPSRKIKIPVCYDISFGVDLEEMSVRKKIPVDEIIRLHTSCTYRVYMIGFLPGFAYMGTVDKQIATPRKAVPRQFVTEGSVGIAGSQTGIYPVDCPGGWNIIGQTPVKMFDKKKDEPCLLQSGDAVNFVSISLKEFEQIKSLQ